MTRSLLLATLVIAAACSGEPPAEVAEVAVEADTVTMSAETIAIAGITHESSDSLRWAETWSVSGRLRSDPATTSPVGSIVEGRIVELRVLPGERVRRGDILALIHTHEIMDARRDLAATTAQVTAATASLAQASRELERTERLLVARAASVADVERARVTVSDARAALATVEAAQAMAHGVVEHLIGDGPTPPDLDPHLAVMRSPIDGLVTERPVQPGQVVLVGAPLYTVAHGDGLVLEAYVPETGLGAARVGATLRFRVPAFRDRVFTAQVTRVAPALDTLSRTASVWARVVDPAPMLRAEMVVQAELQATAGASVLSIPAAAVQVMEGDTVVVVAEPRGETLHLQARPVRIGRHTSERAEVLLGLRAGERVVVQGAAIAKAELLKRRGAFGGEE